MESKLLKTYRGYDGTIEYSDEDKIFYGRVRGIRDSVTYDGKDLNELEKDFHDAVDCYIEIDQADKIEKVATYKVSRNDDGKIVIEDLDAMPDEDLELEDK